MNKDLRIFLLLAGILLFVACDNSISEYEPKSEHEKRIIALLSDFVDAGNAGDLAAIQAAFHENSTYKSVRGGRVTRSRIPDTKPGWWTVAGKVQLLNPKLPAEAGPAQLLRHANSMYISAALFPPMRIHEKKSPSVRPAAEGLP